MIVTGRLAVLTLALIACAKGSREASVVRPIGSSAVHPSMGSWSAIAHGRLADVDVERALYEVPGAPHFYVHVRVRARAQATLGVALAEYAGVFHPNQWLVSDTPHRMGIDEERFLRILPDGGLTTATLLEDAERARLLRDFQTGTMPRARAGGPLDYYRDFNASSRADVEVQSRGHRYVIVVMDGYLDVTDGVDAESIPVDEDSREIAVDGPVEWRVIPAGAIVLSDR
jgi:hypothetical protein